MDCRCFHLDVVLLNVLLVTVIWLIARRRKE